MQTEIKVKIADTGHFTTSELQTKIEQYVQTLVLSSKAERLNMANSLVGIIPNDVTLEDSRTEQTSRI